MTFNDVWVVDARLLGGQQWIKVEVTGSNAYGIPTPRGGHSAVVLDGFMYVFGGNDIEKSFDELWRLELRYLDDDNFNAVLIKNNYF